MDILKLGEIEEGYFKTSTGYYIYLKGGHVQLESFKDCIKLGRVEFVKKINRSISFIDEIPYLIFSEKKYRSNKVKRMFRQLEEGE